MKRVITFCSGFWNAVISDWGSHGFLVNNAPSLNQNQHFSIFSIQTTILVFNIDKACEYQKSVLHFYKALKKYLHKFNKLKKKRKINIFKMFCIFIKILKRISQIINKSKI